MLLRHIIAHRRIAPLKKPAKAKNKAPVKKTVKKAVKKTAAKSVKKEVAKSTRKTAKKAARKITKPAKRVATKTRAKVARTSAAKKVVGKKSPAKKVAAKKPATTKRTAKKSPVKKSVVKKIAARKPAPKPAREKIIKKAVTKPGLSPGLSKAAGAAPLPRPTYPALVEAVLGQLEDAKAEAIVTIDLASKSSVADFMVVASGRSNRHVNAIADQVVDKLSSFGQKNIRVEGIPQCDWVLVDSGDVIVHIFRPEVRSFYNLEKLWSQAPSE